MEKSLLKTQYRTHRIEVKMTQIHRLRGLTMFQEKVIYSSTSKVYPNKPTELKKSPSKTQAALIFPQCVVHSRREQRGAY